MITIIVDAVRKEALEREMQPVELTGMDAERLLADMQKNNPDSVAGRWYKNSPRTHKTSFRNAWEDKKRYASRMSA
jgi:hypothetical protein